MHKSAAEQGSRPKAQSAAIKLSKMPEPAAASSHEQVQQPVQAEVPPSREWSTSTGDSVDGEYMLHLQFRTNLERMDIASLLALSRISAKLGSNIETMVQSELDSRPDTQEAAPSVEVKSEESSSVSRPPACQRFFIDIF